MPKGTIDADPSADETQLAPSVPSYDTGLSMSALNQALSEDGQSLDATKIGDALSSKAKPDESHDQGDDDQDDDEDKTKDPDDNDQGDDNDDQGDDKKDPDQDDDDPDKDLYALDPEAAAKFPKEAKRYEEQRQGLLKVKHQLEARGERGKVVDSWADALESPAIQVTALKDLMIGMAETRKVDMAELLGAVAAAAGVQLVTPSASQDPGNEDDWYELGFSSIEDYQRHLQLSRPAGQKPAPRASDGEPSPLERRLAALEKEQAERNAAAAERQRIAEALTRVQKVFRREHAGFEVTEKMLGQAAKAHPGIELDRAIYAQFGKEIAQHMAKATAELHKGKGPEMVRARGSQGTPRKKWNEVTMHDLNQQLGE